MERRNDGNCSMETQRHCLQPEGHLREEGQPGRGGGARLPCESCVTPVTVRHEIVFAGGRPLSLQNASASTFHNVSVLCRLRRLPGPPIAPVWMRWTLSFS